MYKQKVNILAAAALCGALVGCAAPALQPPSTEVRLSTVSAHGVQIYECRAAGVNQPAWAFVAPQADLFNAHGRRIGTHSAGPHWQHEDGSRFLGTVRSSMDAPRAGAIPWLLLEAKSQDDRGVFAGVSSVQRFNTVGGQAPSDGCTMSVLGERAMVAYRADYVLYGRRS